MIETALVAGFTSVGMDVLLLGPIPTPAVGMLTRSMRADLGVMISASHNPYDDNGIKLFGPDGFKLSDDVEREIEALIDADMTKQLAKSADLGRARRIDGVQDRYIEFAKRTLPRDLSLDGLRVVVDCANGAGLPGRARGAVGTGRRGDRDRRSSRTASTSTRNAARPRPAALCQQGPGDARRHRHRARRRRRPGADRRRKRPDRRRRPDPGGDRRELAWRTAGSPSPASSAP